MGHRAPPLHMERAQPSMHSAMYTTSTSRVPLDVRSMSARPDVHVVVKDRGRCLAPFMIVRATGSRLRRPIFMQQTLGTFLLGGNCADWKPECAWGYRRTEHIRYALSIGPKGLIRPKRAVFTMSVLGLPAE